MYNRNRLGCTEGVQRNSNGRGGMGIAPAVVIAAVPTVVETWQKLFGGRDYTNCVGQPTAVSERIVATVMQRANATELAELNRYWTSPAVHNPPFGTDSVVNTAFALAGGKDCKITTAEGKQARAIFDSLARKYTGADTSLPPSTADQLYQAGQDIIQGAQAGAAQGVQQAIGQQPAVRAAAQQTFLQYALLAGVGVAAVMLLGRPSGRRR